MRCLVNETRGSWNASVARACGRQPTPVPLSQPLLLQTDGERVHHNSPGPRGACRIGGNGHGTQVCRLQGAASRAQEHPRTSQGEPRH